MTLAERVLRTVRRHAMVPPDGRAIVALSGGSDSVSLTWLLRDLAPALPCELVGLVHVNHGLRDAADDDEAFCRALAGRFGLPIVVERIDVRAVALEQHLSVEDAGRQARYHAFERARVELGADAVATGHTRDDQAETFLLRVVRGAGPRGLAGIHPVAGTVVRPLIDVGRDELRVYLADRAEPFREDESNSDLEIPRNRVRHELLPYLRAELSPGIVEILAREAEIARLDADRLDREAIDLAALIVLTNERSVECDAAGLTALHPALASRVARLALRVLAPDKFIGFEHSAQLLALAAGADGGAASLPGQHALRRAGRIVLTREPFRAFANFFRVPLSIPGEVTLDAQGWAVSARRTADPDGPGTDRPDPSLWPARGVAVAVAAGALELPLAVRSRQPGDRFRPSGGRRKKLQDFLVDRKVARESRDNLPLVVDGHDRIVWIVGDSVAEDFRVTGPSQGVIFLTARRLGGPG